MSLTTDKNDPCLNTPKGEGQQNECYLVLSEEERAKGFIRPFRDTYTHVGRNVTAHWKGIHRMLTEEEIESQPHIDKKCVAVMTTLTKEDGSFLGGPYVTQKELDAWKNGERVGGCGASTKMARELAETYARDPNFYGSTWCMGCGKHIDVSEFVWDDGETLGT
jgi:hypothetical protein